MDETSSFRACTGEVVRIDCTTQDCNEQRLKSFINALDCLMNSHRETSWYDPKCPVIQKQSKDLSERVEALRIAKLMFEKQARISAAMLYAAAVNKQLSEEAEREERKKMLQALEQQSVSDTLWFRGIVPFLVLPPHSACDEEKGKNGTGGGWMEMAVIQLLVALATDASSPLLVKKKGKALQIVTANPALISVRLSNLLSAAGLNLSISQRKALCDDCALARGLSDRNSLACKTCRALNLQQLKLDEGDAAVQKGEALRKMLLELVPSEDALANRAFAAVETGNERYFAQDADFEAKTRRISRLIRESEEEEEEERDEGDDEE